LLWLAVILVAGCASQPPIVVQETSESNGARQLARTAPTAEEMETPLDGNGAHGIVVRQHDDPVISESATVPIPSPRDGAFPGMNSDMSQGPMTTTQARAMTEPVQLGPATEARIAALEKQMAGLAGAPSTPPAATIETRAELDRRMRALELRLASLEGGAPPAASVASESMEPRLAAMEERLAKVQALPDSERQALLQQAQTLFDARVAELEAQVARLENRPPAPAVAGPDPRVAELAERLSALETRPASPARSEEAAALEARVAELEAEKGLSPTVMDDGRVPALEARVAALEVRPGAAHDPAAIVRLEERLSQLEGLRASRDAMAAEPGLGGASSSVHVAHLGAPEYRIGAGDILEFYSFDEETLNTEVTVRYDGHVSLPLVPDLQIANTTRAEAETMLRTAYTRIFRDPQVSLIVREPASKTFMVMGDVAAPGIYPFTRATKLVEAVALAGGLRQRSAAASTGGFVGVTGQLTKAFVIRTVNDERQVYSYDLRHLGKPGAHASEAQVHFGDIVYVPEGVNLVYLLGESRNPVIVELTEGMTLLQMLALSGGFNESTANIRSVVIIRAQPDGEQAVVMKVNVREMLKTGRDLPMQPGDIVYIPRKFLVKLEEFVGRVTNSVIPIFDVYLRAVQSYYAKDLAQLTLDLNQQNNTLRVLNQIEAFGQSTNNLVNLFGVP
jgi:polysaccharide export outer membrane protein